MTTTASDTADPIAIREFDPAGSGIELEFVYETDTILHADARESGNGSMSVRFTPRRLAAPLRKRFICALGEPFWNSTRCFACENPAGVALGYAEITPEAWSGRIRLTNLWVKESSRRAGIGRRLVQRVLTAAREDGARAVVLETQSCNWPALLFYRSQGFIFCGCDLCHYANDDVAHGEVRIELVYMLASGNRNPMRDTP